MSDQVTETPAAEESLQRITDEQAALHRVARLVAEGADSLTVFNCVCEEAGRLIGATSLNLAQYTPDGFNVTTAGWSVRGIHLPVGTRLRLAPDTVGYWIRQTSAPARIDNYEDATSELAVLLRELGIRSAVAAPVVVDGQVWGALAAGTDAEEPLPAGTEERLARFTELVVMAIANAQARDGLRVLADEQAALRRVATLVARESSPVEIFGAVTEEACRVLASEAVGLLRFDPDETATLVAQSDTPWDPPPLGTRFTLDGDNVVTRVFRTGQTVRMDDWTGSTGAVAAMASVLGVRSAVASPVVVQGLLWGTIIAATSQHEPLPATTESRLVQFTGLVATAIANAEARGALSRLAQEQAALGRVATLVAQGAPSTEVFEAVATEVGTLLDTDITVVGRYDEDGVATAIGSWSSAPGGMPVGTRSTLGGRNILTMVAETGMPARIDDYSEASGEAAEIAVQHGWRSSIGAPICIDNLLWGVMLVTTRRPEPFPTGAEERLENFTELLATAIANTASRSALERLADEQAALRRVATLVAQDAPPADLFRAVAVEIGTLLGADFSGVARLADGAVIPLAGWASEGQHPPLPERWPMQPGDPVTAIAEARRTVRWDSWTGIAGPIAAFIRDELEVCSTVGTPIVVEGRMWGVLAVHSKTPLPQDSESRVEQFSNLVATAIGNADARGEVARLANEQAALRQIATLVARGVEPEQVFAAVTEETAATFRAITVVIRFEHDPPANVIVGVSKETGIPIGTRWPIVEGMASAVVYRTGRSARVGGIDWSAHPEPTVAEAGLRFGVTVQVSCPIIVDGNLWGVVTVNGGESLPGDTEQRLEKFTELVTTAIANAEAGVALRSAADEQGALRRVATLVASSAAPSDVFAAVTHEIALVLGSNATMLCRVDPDGAAVVVGTWADGTPEPPLGTRIARGGRNLTTIVLETGHPARIENYSEATGDGSELGRAHGLRSAVGAPILVEGRLWGLVVAGTTHDEPLPPDAEARLVGFTELVATAIANAQAHGDLASLAEQQAALRRVATLVARRATPEVVFRAVAEEAGGFLGADLSALVRLESDNTVTLLAGSPPGPYETGERVPIDPGFVVDGVRKTGRPARFETDDPEAEGMPSIVRRLGIRSAVASPIAVEGAIWGAVVLGSFGASFPRETEQRLDEFTELVATAISNATARAELVASRARIVAAGDEARRRIERNLHDGTQQRLIALGLDIAAVRASVPEGQGDLDANLERLEGEVDEVLGEVRELSRGLHPGLLSRQGLGPSLRALARRSALPISLEVDLPERPPEPVETATYFVVSEALTNAVKYAHASYLTVSISVDESHLHATISDDGVGGAEPGAGAGSGLIGLVDRVNALGGQFHLESPPGGGTTISIELPLAQ